MIDILTYNRNAWDSQVQRGNRWTVPVSSEVIAQARNGDWSIILTPTRGVPMSWFPALVGTRTLCLASGGGQQAPVLAAAGADVTVFDNSPGQLAQDQFVAERDGLNIKTVQGDMRDLSAFDDNSFDLIVHPCSNCFVPDVLPVWHEAARVLRPGGLLLAGFTNPALFIFDDAELEKGTFIVRHRLPYSDVESLTDAERQRLVDANEPFIFSHTLESLIGGQCDAGFAITGCYEDTWPDRPLSEYMQTFIATRAVKLLEPIYTAVHRMIIRTLIIWFALVIVAVINGTIRQAILISLVGDQIGHIISSIMLSAAIFLVAWYAIRWIGPQNIGDAIRIGSIWLAMTIAFEFLAGHYLFGNPWTTLLADYNIARGRVWVIVLVATLIAPMWAFRRRQAANLSAS